MFKAILHFSPNSRPLQFLALLGVKRTLRKSSVRVLTPLNAHQPPSLPYSPPGGSSPRRAGRCTPSVQNRYLFFVEESVLLDSSAQNSFTEHVLDIRLTRYVTYVPNGFSQVKVPQARANTIFRQDKVTVLLKTVRSTIKPIDQPLELLLQRDTEIETKIAWPFSL